MTQPDSKSSSGQQQQQTAQTVQYSFPYPQQFEDDTIDFYELWITLWNMKWLVIAVTVVAALGSVVYALVTPRVYKAEAMLLRPYGKDLQSMNVLEMHHKNVDNLQVNYKVATGITPDSVFNKFKQNLNSRNLHKKFIHENDLMDVLAPDRTPETREENIYREFAGLINAEDVNGIFTLSIELSDAEIAVQLVNKFIEFIDKETITMLVDDLRNTIANQITYIEYTIDSKRQMAKQRREDQVVRFEEAAKIAKSLGIKRRVDATNIIQNTQMNVDIATATTPLYYLGFEALSTEIAILKNRASDDHFIAGLRDLQEYLTLIKSIKFDEEKLHAVQIDEPAYMPQYPIRPNRRLIVSLGTVFGLFSGILLVYLIEFVQNQRKKHSE